MNKLSLFLASFRGCPRFLPALQALYQSAPMPEGSDHGDISGEVSPYPVFGSMRIFFRRAEGIGKVTGGEHGGNVARQRLCSQVSSSLSGLLMAMLHPGFPGGGSHDDDITAGIYQRLVNIFLVQGPDRFVCHITRYDTAKIKFAAPAAGGGQPGGQKQHRSGNQFDFGRRQPHRRKETGLPGASPKLGEPADRNVKGATGFFPGLL